MGDVRVTWPLVGTCPTTNKHWKCKKLFGTVVLIMVQFSNMNKIVQLPESILFMLSYSNLPVPLRCKKQ